jgi:hypothetical protein
VHGPRDAVLDRAQLELVVNAKLLGVTIRTSIPLRADG